MFTVNASGFTLQNAYEILPGQPNYYIVTSENENEEVATEPFQVEVELYDLTADQREQNNVASQNPDVVQKIEQIMRDARTTPAIAWASRSAVLHSAAAIDQASSGPRRLR